MLIATWLVPGHDGCLIPDRRHIAKRLAEAALTKLVAAPEKFDRIVDAERSQHKLHGSIVLVAQGQDVSPHAPILASPAKQNRQRKLPVELASVVPGLWP